VPIKPRNRHLVYAVLGALALGGPFILGNLFLRDLLVLFVIFAILALSMDIIMGYMGQLSFGHQAFFGLGAYTTAMLSTRLGASPWLGILVAVALAAAFGFLVGYIALRVTRGVYLSIITYGIATALWVVVRESYEFTGGPSGIYPLPPLAITVPHLPQVIFNNEVSFYYLAFAFVIFTAYLIIRWLHSRFGRAVIAIRENEELAKSVGIYSFRYYVLAFTLATALAGLSGGLYAHYLRFVNPMLFSPQYLFMMLIMVIIGGTGTIGGPILGSAIYVFVLESLPTAREVTYVIFGIIVVLLVLFMPQGIYPRLSLVFNRLISRKKEVDKTGNRQKA
jgi:branched-chain amino acid transport system permease protein